MKENKLSGASVAFGVVRALTSLAGAVAFMMFMIKPNVTEVADAFFKTHFGEGVTKEFSIIDIFSFMQKFSEKFGDINEFKTAVLIVLTVTVLTVMFTMFLIVFSFARFKSKNVVLIFFSLLSALVALFWIMFVPRAGTAERYNVILSAGKGAYIFLGSSAFSLILALIDIVISHSKSRDDDDETIITDGPLHRSLIGENPNMNYQNNQAPGYYPAPVPPVQNLLHTLKAVSGEYTGFDFPLEPGDPLVIGKDPELCAIVITKNNDFISRKHCTVVNENGDVLLIDHSTNGVFVNSQRITKGIPLKLNPGAHITLAGADTEFIAI